VTVSDSGAGSLYSLAALDGGGGEGGGALLPVLLPSLLLPSLLLPPPLQDDNISEQLVMIAVICLRMFIATT
jgi:hypothetical protein